MPRQHRPVRRNNEIRQRSFFTELGALRIAARLEPGRVAPDRLDTSRL